jgi:hypothetical protein
MKMLDYFLKLELHRTRTSLPPATARATSPLTAFCGPFPPLYMGETSSSHGLDRVGRIKTKFGDP